MFITLTIMDRNEDYKKDFAIDVIESIEEMNGFTDITLKTRSISFPVRENREKIHKKIENARLRDGK